MEARHDTVLLAEAVDALDVREDDIVVDATVGGAGHFRSLLERLGSKGTLIGIDADEDALARAQAVVDADSRESKPCVVLVPGNFRTIEGIVSSAGTGAPEKILFDLGWSGFQLSRGRGFSFREDEPLLMTYGEPQEGKTAADLVNTASEEELVELLYTYGEERFARGISKAIVRARKAEKILTTTRLAEVVASGTPGWYQHRRLHPATKTFQALRIAVNDELGALREGLSSALSLVPEGGRVAVITFHSIEDRIVKGMFREAAYAGQGCLYNRKPLVPSESELKENPRARSAKLRVFIRENTEPKDVPLFHNQIAYV